MLSAHYVVVWLVVGQLGWLVVWLDCGGVAGWSEFLLGTRAGLDQCHTVLDGVEDPHVLLSAMHLHCAKFH